MRTPRKMKAWLVTWEWMSDHAERDDKIAAVLNSRLSTPRVKELVEFLYLTECYPVSEQMAFAQRRRDNPYPARYEETKSGSLISCGHNPYLRARLVDDLTVESDAYGFDTAVKWKTRQRKTRTDRTLENIIERMHRPQGRFSPQSEASAVPPSPDRINHFLRFVDLL